MIPVFVEATFCKHEKLNFLLRKIIYTKKLLASNAFDLTEAIISEFRNFGIPESKNSEAALKRKKIYALVS